MLFFGGNEKRMKKIKDETDSKTLFFVRNETLKKSFFNAILSYRSHDDCKEGRGSLKMIVDALSTSCFTVLCCQFCSAMKHHLISFFFLFKKTFSEHSLYLLDSWFLSFDQSEKLWYKFCLLCLFIADRCLLSFWQYFKKQDKETTQCIKTPDSRMQTCLCRCF